MALGEFGVDLEMVGEGMLTGCRGRCGGYGHEGRLGGLEKGLEDWLTGCVVHRLSRSFDARLQDQAHPGG